jgi:hypothetical protein
MNSLYEITKNQVITFLSFQLQGYKTSCTILLLIQSGGMIIVVSSQELCDDAEVSLFQILEAWELFVEILCQI